jgi:transcriptional regulator GlxA family with amidase domain
VDRDSIYVRNGNTWTSASVIAGIDLALALVAEDYGRKAAAVARQLSSSIYAALVASHNLSALLAAQDAGSEPVQGLLAWLPDHLTEDLTVPKLARRANLSERHFSRVFKAEVGATRPTTSRRSASRQPVVSWRAPLPPSSTWLLPPGSARPRP